MLASADTRVVLVGEAPGPNTRPNAPLFPAPVNSAGYRLYKLTGLSSRNAYLRRFQRANLLREHPGTWTSSKRGKDRWPSREARFAADAMRHLLYRRNVIFVGRRVAEAFGYSRTRLPFLWWHEDAEWRMQVACLPHPSGRSHWYNDPEHVMQARRFFHNLLHS